MTKNSDEMAFEEWFKRDLKDLPKIHDAYERHIWQSATAFERKRSEKLLKALEYYSFAENHSTQTVLNKEKRRDEYASAVYFCDDSGERARQAIKDYKENYE